MAGPRRFDSAGPRPTRQALPVPEARGTRRPLKGPQPPSCVRHTGVTKAMKEAERFYDEEILRLGTVLAAVGMRSMAGIYCKNDMVLTRQRKA